MWFVDPTTNQRCFLKQYVFYGNRTPKAEIFKIPETSRSEMLVASDAQCYEADDFYLWYKKGGYTGLNFVELWSCD